MSPKVTSVVLGALAIALLYVLLSLIPTIGAFLSCLAVIGGAMIAVWHYTSANNLTVPAGEGAGIGAMAGALGAVVAIALGLLLVQMGLMPDPQQVIDEQLRDMPADQREMAERIGGWAQGPVGWAMSVVVNAILGAIGGAIGGAVFKRGEAADPYGPTGGA
jgi:MFS family permease